MGVGAAPIQVSCTVPTFARLLSVSNGAHSRSWEGSVSACQTFSGEWRSSRTRINVHLSPSLLRTSAPVAGPGMYGSRWLISFSLSSFWVVISLRVRALRVRVDAGGRDGVRARRRERTRSGGTGRARHRSPGAAPGAGDRDGAGRRRSLQRNRLRAGRAGAGKRRAAAGGGGARSHPPTAGKRRADSGWRGGSARR